LEPLYGSLQPNSSSCNPTATIDFTAATTALGTAVADIQTFVLAQGLVIFAAVAVVAAVFTVLGVILRRMNLRKAGLRRAGS